MGYFFLALSLISGTVKGYCGKKTSNYTKEYKSAVFASCIRMLLCMAIGIVCVFVGGNAKYLMLHADALFISALSGISTAVFVVSWLISVKKSAYMMLDIFLTSGIVIPLVLCNIFFGETVTFIQWAGFAVVMIGVFIMGSYNNGLKEKINAKSLLILILCGASNGIADFSQKLFIRKTQEIPIVVFNFYTYVFSSIVLFVLYFICQNRTQECVQKQKDIYKMYIYIFVMSICLFAYSYFKTSAAVFLDAAKLYPLSQGGALILSSIMSSLLLGEKITVKSFIGTFFAFVGLLAINVL